MRHSADAETLTTSFEGFRSVAYWDDKGKCWTIAYGHTRGVYKGMTCDRVQGLQWLREDYASAEANVNTHLDHQIPQDEFDALCDFDFNVGDGNLNKSTLLKLVKAGRLSEAAAEFEKWEYAGGVKLAGLLRRRQAEEALFRKGIEGDTTDDGQTEVVS